MAWMDFNGYLPHKKRTKGLDLEVNMEVWDFGSRNF